MAEKKSALCSVVWEHNCVSALLGRAHTHTHAHDARMCVRGRAFMEDIGSRFPPFYAFANVDGPIRMGKLIQSDELINAAMRARAHERAAVRSPPFRINASGEGGAAADGYHRRT